MKNGRKVKRTVALLWLVAYVALLIIPFLGNLYILMAVNSAVKHETESKYNYFLKALSANIDSGLRNVIVTSKAISENNLAKDLSNTEIVTPQVIYDLSQLRKEIRDIIGTTDYLEGFIYYPKIDKIVTSENYYDTKDYFESDILRNDEGYENYDEMLKKPYGGVIKTKTKDEKGKEKEIFTFLNTVGQPYNLEYVIGISADSKGLFGGEFNNKDGDIIVLKQRGDIYISTNNNLAAADLSIVKDLNPYETKKINLQGNETGISYVRSEFSNYRYVYVDYTGYIYTTANKMLVVGACVSLTCLILMGLILFNLYGWNYTGLKEIMHGFDADGALKRNENEFEFIKRQIKLNKQRQKTMEEEISSHMEVLREEFLTEVMRGSINDVVYIEEGMHKNNISFDGNFFCITAIYVQDMGVLKDISLKNTFFIIKNIMHDICRNESYYSVEYGDRLFCIFNFKQNTGIQEYLRSLLIECSEVTNAATEIVFYSVTSEVGTGIESLHYLYESVITGVNLSEFYGMDEHVFKEDIETMYSEPNAAYLESTENEILLCIKIGDVASFEDLLEKLFADKIALNHRWVVMGRAYSVLNGIFRMIDGMDSNDAKEAFEKLNSFKEYDNIKSIKSFVCEYGIYAMEILNNNSKEKSELYQKAVEYINNHYTEADLNVNKVGEELGVTSIYLAYVVKQNSGMKLSEYIAKLRIETAKELLKSEHDMKIEQIAEKSGFWQNRTFYNTFKKYTGFTPTQYRNSNKGE